MIQDAPGGPAPDRQPQRAQRLEPPRGNAVFAAVCACAGFICGGLLGMVVGAGAGMVHLSLYWRGGGKAAGTEVALVFAYAIPGAILGAIAGVAGGSLFARRR
jgi:hypothetical protein